VIKVELSTKLVGDNSHIWTLHPGMKQKFIDDFVSNSIIFLDLPRLELTKSDELNAPAIRQKIQRSRVWREYELGRLRDSVHGRPLPPVPNFDLAGFVDDPRNKSITADQISVNAIYFSARRGDLILVPEGRGQFGHVRFAEVLDDFDPTELRTIAGYSSYTVHTRSVRWLSAMPKRRDLPEAIARQVENRRAATQIDRSFLGDIVYSVAYSSFSSKGVSKTARDLIPTIELVSWLLAAYDLISTGRAHKINLHSVSELANSDFGTHLVKDFAVQFSSKGQYLVRLKDPAAALFVAGAVALFTIPGDSVNGRDKIEVSNGGKIVQAPPELATAKALDELIKVMKPTTRTSVEKLAERARRKIGLESAARATRADQSPATRSERSARKKLEQ
jgi:hypothetical protein